VLPMGNHRVSPLGMTFDSCHNAYSESAINPAVMPEKYMAHDIFKGMRQAPDTLLFVFLPCREIS
jgi:hypothetical protein